MLSKYYASNALNGTDAMTGSINIDNKSQRNIIIIWQIEMIFIFSKYAMAASITTSNIFWYIDTRCSKSIETDGDNICLLLIFKLF